MWPLSFAFGWMQWYSRKWENCGRKSGSFGNTLMQVVCFGDAEARQTLQKCSISYDGLEEHGWSLPLRKEPQFRMLAVSDQVPTV